MAYKTILILFTCLAVSFAVAEEGCQEIMVPMCRGLIGYTHTKLPNSLGHSHQTQVYRFLEPIWQFMDRGCSNNLRLLACGMALPECTKTGNKTKIELPCREACLDAKTGCTKDMKSLGFKWPKELKCNKLRRKNQQQCLEPNTRIKGTRRPQYAYCRPNTFPMCQNLTFTIGTLPNMFLQSDESDILTELEQYQALAESNCHENLWFLICGVFRPYCIASNPFALPCREMCEDVRQQCEQTYTALYGGLRWPAKLQCHRYPAASSSHNCVVPADTALAQIN